MALESRSLAALALTLTLAALVAGCRREQPHRAPALETHQRPAAELPPQQARAGQTWVDPVDHAAMVYVPAGEALVGAPAGAAQADWYAPNRPLRKVHVAGFWMDRQPVSNARYRRFVQATGFPEPWTWHNSHGPPIPPWEWMVHWPAQVGWNEAMVYSLWAGKSLPTEDEWEVAARGTDGRRFPWGKQWPKRLKVYDRPARQMALRLDVSPYGCLDMLFLHQWTGTVEPPEEAVVKGDVSPYLLLHIPDGTSMPGPSTWHRIPALWSRQVMPTGWRGPVHEEGAIWRWSFRCSLRPTHVPPRH